MEILNNIFNIFLPEFVLLLTIIVNTILAFSKKEISYRIFKLFSVIALSVATGCLFWTQSSIDYHYFINNSFVVNIYTAFVKCLILMSFFLIMLFSRKTIQAQKENAPFYCNALILATLGAMFLVSSNNFISTLIALLVSNIGGILVAKYSQNEKIITKYILISFLALICYLVGSGMFYSIFGEINFETLSENLHNVVYDFKFLVASVLIISSLCFQIFAFPFVSWKNHICKSLSYPSLTFLSTIPMIAGLSVISRIYVFIFSYFEILKYLLAIIGIISIFFGVVLGFKKENLKEIMTSSTTIQSGIMLLGLSGFSVYSLSGVLFWLLVYTIATITLGASLTILNKPNLTSYQGLVYKRPYYALCTSICFLSLAGLAPTCGFISKIYLLSSVANSGVIYMLFMIIAMFLMLGVVLFYFKLASISFLNKAEINENFNNEVLAKAILYICTMLICIFTIFPEKILKLCQIIAYYI